MLPSLLYSGAKPKHPAMFDNREDLVKDLGMESVISAMGRGVPAIMDTARATLFESPAVDCGKIPFRQRIIKDAISNRHIFLELYELTAASVSKYEEARLKSQPGYARVAPVTLRIRTACELLGILITLADRVRITLEKIDAGAVSAGLSAYIREFKAFYSKNFIASACREIENVGRISEGAGLKLGVRIGNGMKGSKYAIRSVNQPVFMKRAAKRKGAAFVLDTFQQQFKALELRDAAVHKLLNIMNAVVLQTADDLKTLYYELGFYVGCMNLIESVEGLGLPVCFPTEVKDGSDALAFDGLVDISLALSRNVLPVPNSVNMDGVRLTVVTGANQGGKSTFLRSVGCAQLMAQCGMFVTARELLFCARPRIFTHFCKPEDAAMNSGKLDEELVRLGFIVDRLVPESILLMNESFSSTAELEGAAIAREVIGAFRETRVKVIFVTHLYDFARSVELSNATDSDALFLRAERRDDGSRTYMLKKGFSLPTSYGMDLFNELFPES